MTEFLIVSASLFLIEDTVNFLIQSSVVIKGFMARYMTLQRSSIVRKIGSKLTCLKARRIIVWIEKSCDSSQSSAENVSLNSNSIHTKITTENCIPSVQWEIKIEELEKELSSLQAKVTQILVDQKKQFLDIDERSNPTEISPENVVSSSISITSSFHHPPPPPPPLPPMPLVQNQSLFKVKPKRVNAVKEKVPACSIIEELSKKPPKLRHVELSPGGRPVRSVSLVVDPSDILTAVLRKRFEAIHSPREEYALPTHGSPENQVVWSH